MLTYPTHSPSVRKLHESEVGRPVGPLDIDCQDLPKLREKEASCWRGALGRIDLQHLVEKIIEVALPDVLGQVP